MLAVVARRAGGDTGELKLPERGKILASWMLPVMAAAMEEDEEEAKAIALLESVRNLSRKNEQKHVPV